MDTPPTALQQAQEWFSLDWYQDAERFSALEWAVQVNKRVAIKYAFSAGEETRQTLNFLMSDLTAEPLGNPRSRPYSNTTEAIASLPYATGSVIPLAHHDFDRLNALRKVVSGHSDSAIDEWSRLNEQLLPLTRFGHLKVDMNARDDDILSAFRHWLTAYRQIARATATKPYRKDRADEMQSWHESKLLPYFDLTMWGLWNGGLLKEDEIMDLLFPNDANRTRDWLRSKMTKADAVITLQNAIALSVA